MNGFRWQPRRSFFLLALAVSFVLFALLRSEQEKPRGITLKKASTLSVTTDPLYKESHALVIGVSQYTGGWPNLPGVKADLEAVTQVLQKYGFHVVIVENPTLSELERAYRDFVVRYGLGTDNRLLLYFAGHGYTHKPSYATNDPNEWMGYIVAQDAPLPKKDIGPFLLRAMSMQRFADIARQIEAKHVLFVFDSCFSGSIFALSRAHPPDTDVLQMATKPVRQFISSGSADQEVSDAGGFRRQLIAALDGAADRNRDGYVTGSELGSFLRETVPNYEKQTPQYGKIRDPLLDKGDFLFPLQVTASASPPTLFQEKKEEQVVSRPPPPLRLQGHLQVNVNVESAMVRIDGTQVGLVQRDVPLVLRDLTVGTVRVQVEAEGYESLDRLVKIAEQQWTQEGFVLQRRVMPEQIPIVSAPAPSPNLPPASLSSQLQPEPSQSDDVVTYWGIDSSGNLVPHSAPNIKPKAGKKEKKR